MIARSHSVIRQGVAVEYVRMGCGGRSHPIGAHEIVKPEPLVDVAGESPLRPVCEVARGV
jgi:hypothetical protein